MDFFSKLHIQLTAKTSYERRFQWHIGKIKKRKNDVWSILKLIDGNKYRLPKLSACYPSTGVTVVDKKLLLSKFKENQHNT